VEVEEEADLMEEDVLNALQMRCAYLSGGYDREKRIIFIVNAFNDQQLWNRRCLQLTLDYLKRSLRWVQEDEEEVEVNETNPLIETN